MADITSICNQALGAVGTRSSIASINEASNEARACLLQYDTTRKHLLRAAHWGFARAYQNLAVYKARSGTPENPSPPTLTSEPPQPWHYVYNLPQDNLAIRYLQSFADGGTISPPIFSSTTLMSYPADYSGPTIKFELATVDGRTVILTNYSKTSACYTKDITDPSYFDESFTRALVQGLAANISTSITGDLKLFDALLKTANSLILEARVRNANESINVIDTLPDWLRVRGVGPSAGSGAWVPEYGPLFGGTV